MSNVVKLRAIILTLLLVVAVLVSFTGVVLYFAPTGGWKGRRAGIFFCGEESS
ncbi:MAG: hypothetical protein J7L88_05535 [Thermoplasmata archaeon]|nr:hypothetical protein [Thermoplasmata archaeon]